MLFIINKISVLLGKTSYQLTKICVNVIALIFINRNLCTGIAYINKNFDHM